jgi:hypothetical protein
MKKYEIYDPSGFDLPALKINKRQSRKNIENDSAVNNLIESKLLLNPEFNSLYLNIFKKSNKINDLFIISKINKLETIFEILFSIKKDVKLYRAFINVGMELITFMNKTPSNTHNRKKKATEPLTYNLNIAIKEMLNRLSTQIQNDLSNFEENIKIDLSVLPVTTVCLCKNCNKIISWGKFKSTKCSCGEDINNPSQVDQIPIYHFTENIINFIKNNYWFEYGIDYILRKKNLQTRVGYDVLGNSGVWHEIDIIAYCKNDNYRFFCECKNSEINEKDVFIFSGKMIDIGGTRGYILTTSNNISDKISRLARSKNIDVIKGVLGKDSEILMDDIKED